MKIVGLLSSLWSQDPLSLLRFLRDWRSSVRTHFLYAAIESGLLEAVKTPSSRDELMQRLHVQRPELLDALLDLGLATGELARENGHYRVKGKRAKALLSHNGDMFSALIQAQVTYYNSVYRHASDRIMGAPLGRYLEEIAGVVARFSKLDEPFIRNFVDDLVAGKGPMRILDVGCGSGLFLCAAIEANPDATGIGIEMDENVVGQAQRNLADWGISNKCQVFAGDVRAPPPTLTGPFDLIMLFSAIYYFSVAERPALFRSLQSLLSSQGAVAVVSATQSRGKDVFAANLNLATSSIVGCTPLPDIDELVSQLRESGFKSVEKTRLLPNSAVYGIVCRGAEGAK